METLIIINFILTIALCAVVYLHLRNFRKFVLVVQQFAKTVADAQPLKRGVFIGLGAIVLIALMRKIFGGSENESAE